MEKESYNYYEILDVTPESSQHHIHNAYQQAKLTYSFNNPEVYNFFTTDEVRDWNDLIEEAYSVIGHPNTRRDYDKEMDINTSPTKKVAPPQRTQPAPLPEGYARTLASQYRVDPNMEDYLKNHEPCDGLFLKKARTYKNIELTDFSRCTCIAVRHLYAIENNNFSVLPAPVFVRGYIIQYCRLLGLDEERVVTAFMQLLKDGI